MYIEESIIIANGCMHYSFLLIKTFLDLRLIMSSMADYNCRNDNQHVQRQLIYMDFCVLYDSDNLDLNMKSIKTEKTPRSDVEHPE